MPSPISPVRAHPYLAAYGAAFLVVWVVTIATWTLRPAATPDLHPAAAVLQYILVAVAAALAALRMRIERADSHSEATFGFYDYRWRVSDRVGGQSFWVAIGVGMAAMVLDVAVLAAADVVVAGHVAAGSYLGWIGAAIGAGALLGILGAMVAAAAAVLVRWRQR